VGAPSLTRGRVCLLYMLLALASSVFLGSRSLGTRDHILLSQSWDFPFHRLLRLAGSRWRSRVCYSRYSLCSLRTDHAQETRPLLLRSADRTGNTTHVVTTQRVYWRADDCLATSYKHSSYCCVFTISLPSNENTSPISGQVFVFAGSVYKVVPQQRIYMLQYYTRYIVPTLSLER
jgi:hypothetical protein